MVKRWTVGLSHFLVVRRAPLCETKGIPGKKQVMSTNVTTSTSLSKNVNEQGWNHNTDLCMDVKTFLRNDRITQLGKDYSGVLRRDSDYHYTFTENDLKEKTPASILRSPHVYRGTCVNVVRRADGNLYPTFNRPKYTESYGYSDFCLEAAKELIAVSCLGEEGGTLSE